MDCRADVVVVIRRIVIVIRRIVVVSALAVAVVVLELRAVEVCLVLGSVVAETVA